MNTFKNGWQGLKHFYGAKLHELRLSGRFGKKALRSAEQKEADERRAQLEAELEEFLAKLERNHITNMELEPTWPIFLPSSGNYSDPR